MLCVCSPDRDVHNLVIRNACHAHGGVYKAVIANKVGKAACYAHLYVTGMDKCSMFDAVVYRIQDFPHNIFMYLKIGIVPDPPDGPPVIEAITGKTITLSWKRPKKLDPSFGSFSFRPHYVPACHPNDIFKQRMCWQMLALCCTWCSSRLWAPSSGPSWCLT